MKKINGKTFLFLGILFIIISFGCVGAGLFQLFKSNQQTTHEMGKKLNQLSQQKAFVEKTAKTLANHVGTGIEVDRLVSAAKAKYGAGELQRKDGDLWIDRNGGEWVITLGALNGVKEGMQLGVFKGNTKVGTVRVEKALDVVSYVRPVGPPGNFPESSYRVAVE